MFNQFVMLSVAKHPLRCQPEHSIGSEALPKTGRMLRCAQHDKEFSCGKK